jgi:hypothetical protein
MNGDKRLRRPFPRSAGVSKDSGRSAKNQRLGEFVKGGPSEPKPRRLAAFFDDRSRVAASQHDRNEQGISEKRQDKTSTASRGVSGGVFRQRRQSRSYPNQSGKRTTRQINQRSQFCRCDLTGLRALRSTVDPGLDQFPGGFLTSRSGFAAWSGIPPPSHQIVLGEMLLQHR